MPQKITGREQRTLCVRNLGKVFTINGSSDMWITNFTAGNRMYWITLPAVARPLFPVSVRTGAAGGGRSVGNGCFCHAIPGGSFV